MICHLHYASQPCAQCAARSEASATCDRTVSAPAVVVFKEHVPEHIFAPWERAHSVSTPGELLRESEKRGVTPNYLRDSLIWRSRSPKWF